MNIRAILVGAAVVAFGGYALYDYYGPESKHARELKEIEQLEPDIKPRLLSEELEREALRGRHPARSPAQVRAGGRRRPPIRDQT